MYYSHDRNSHNIVMMHQNRQGLSPSLHDHHEAHYHHHDHHSYNPHLQQHHIHHHPEHGVEVENVDKLIVALDLEIVSSPTNFSDRLSIRSR